MTEIERIRLQSQERAYQKSVAGLRPLQKSQKDAKDNDMSGFKWATNFGLQVIVAFIGAFALGYFFVETFVSQDNQVAKVLAGAGCSFATLLLEVTLWVVHEQKEEMIKKKRLTRDKGDGKRSSGEAKPIQ